MSADCEVRYYVRGSIVPFDEDDKHEFKGHSNITEDDLPSWVHVPSDAGRRTRQPLCKVLTAFINSGEGGNVYIGVHDDGAVRGMQLTRLQRDHMLVALEDMMSRCRPPVLQHRYSVHFLPVLDEATARLLEKRKVKLEDVIDDETRAQPHTVRTSAYCSCDVQAIASFNNGQLPNSYVVHIVLKAWDPTDSRNIPLPGLERIPPLHEAEAGETYIRCTGSVKRLLAADVDEQSRALTQQLYGARLHRMRLERLQLLLDISRLKGEHGTRDLDEELTE